MFSIFKQKINHICLIFMVALIIFGSACSRFPSPEQPTINGETIITFAAAEDQRGFYEPLMEVFHEQKLDITVQFVALKELDNDLHALASAADTTLLWGDIIASGGSGYFRDLNPLIEADPDFQEDDFWPGLLSACQDVEGRTVGIPLNVSLAGVFFDRAAFDQAGLPYPAPGWTWDDFQQAVAALAQQSKDGINYGFVDNATLRKSILAPLVTAYLDQNQGKIVDQTLVQELQWYFDLAGEGALYPLKEPANSLDVLQTLFGENRPAMWISPLNAAMPDYSGNAIDKDGFAPFPVAGDGSLVNTTLVDVTCAGLSAGSAHPQEAWAWLDFLSRYRDTQVGTNPLVDLPVRRSVAEETAYFQALPQEVEPSVRFILGHACYGSRYPEAFKAVQKALRDAFTNRTSLIASLEMTPIGTETVTGQTEGNEIQVNTPPPPPAGGTTVIQYYGLGGNYVQALDVLAEAFHQDHPDIQVRIAVDLEGISPAPGSDPFTRAAEQNDCFAFDTLVLSGSAVEQVISLNPLLAAEPAEFILDFYPSLVDAGRLEGELYSLPMVSQPYVMVYNVELLARRGVPVPTDGWTFDDFISLATAAASQFDSDQTYGAVYNEDLFLAGRSVSGLDLSTYPPLVNFDTLKMASALTWLAGLAQSNVLLVETQDNPESTSRAVISGKVAFWVGQAGGWGYWWPFERPSFKIGVAPLPSTPGIDELLGETSVTGQFISQRAEDPRACWEWMKFLSGQPNIFDGIPARRSVAESLEYEAVTGKEAAKILRSALEDMEHMQSEARSISIGWPLSYWQRGAIAAALQGDNPQLALTAAQGKAEAYLACITKFDIEKRNIHEQQDLVIECARQADLEWDKLFLR
jgi:ABC-type glycerol-3-phosphate transport system substrate-binding protein